MRLVDHPRITACKKSAIPARVSAESGFFIRRKGGKKVAFQSSLERSFVQMCDFANETVELKWEPFTLLFDDLVDQKERRYTPDYLLEFTTKAGSRATRIVEVKPKQEIARIWRGDPYGVDARRHVAMMAWCDQQIATRFVLASEEFLMATGLPNIVAISHRSSYPVADPTRQRLLEFADQQTGVMLDQFVDEGMKLGVDRGTVVSSLLRLCADDELWFDIAGQFNDDTVFNRGPRRRVFSA